MIKLKFMPYDRLGMIAYRAVITDCVGNDVVFYSIHEGSEKNEWMVLCNGCMIARHHFSNLTSAKEYAQAHWNETLETWDNKNTTKSEKKYLELNAQFLNI